MIVRKWIAPSHAVFFISDFEPQESPMQGEYRRIVGDDKCILVPCDCDEGVKLVMGHSADLRETGTPAFVGHLQTPSRIVSCQTVGLYELISLPVETTLTKVSIWTNDAKFPTRVVVGLG